MTLCAKHIEGLNPSGRRARVLTAEKYRAAGVDLDVAEQVKETIKALARITHTPQVLTSLGGFTGLFSLEGCKEPVLAAHTDGVGTKVKVAAILGHFESLGQDVVHLNVNDLITCGAKPVAFLDYIGLGSLTTLGPQPVEIIVRGISWACKQIGCALLGGETAQMPGTYAADDFDLVGFAIGVVERSKIIDGSAIAAGDVVLGVPSSGVHTNGFSLIRRVFKIEEDHRILYKRYEELGHALGEELLIPHRSYYPMVESAFPHVKGLAHITGGGMLKNVPRILPKGLAAKINRSACRVPPIFKLIQKTGDVPEEEMWRVFNMGIGMVIVCSPEKMREVRRLLPEAIGVGEIVRKEGEQGVVFS